MEEVGSCFQRETRHIRGQLAGWGMDWEHQPAWRKSYAHAPRVALPPRGQPSTGTLWEAIELRRSERSYHGPPITAQELSTLLWAGQGITGEASGQRLRAAPSAGALYPIETYLAVREVVGVPAGLYHYAVGDQALEQLQSGDRSAALARAALDQAVARSADVVLVWSAVFARSVWKYGQRAYRYIYLDAGHIAENVALAATSLCLGSCPIAALYDDEVNALFGLDGVEESVVYMTSIGRI